MGKRGPNKKPTELKLLDGTFRSDRDGDLARKVVPDPITGELVPPDDFGPVALDYWNTQLPLLLKLGVIREGDEYAFIDLCRAVERVAECDEFFKTEEKYYATETGLRAHPMVGIRKQYNEEKMKLIGKFGRTPADRTNIEIDREPPKSVDFEPLKQG